MQNTVFYSKAKIDENSPRVLQMMQNMPFANDFLYYCVDADPVTKKRNTDLLTVLGITDVPTMYIDGQKYVGEAALDWLRMQMYQLQMGNGAGAQFDPHSDRQLYESFASQYPPQQQNPYTMGHNVPIASIAHPPQTIPGMGQMTQTGGFPAMGMNGRMAPPQMGGLMGMNGMGGTGQPLPSGPLLQGNGAAGSGGPAGGLHGGASAGLLGNDSSYADPFAPTDITGINSLTGMSAEQILTPIQTKNQDNGARMDEMLKHYSMERESMIPQQQPPTIPGLNMSMQQMAIPQMGMRR